MSMDQNNKSGEHTFEVIIVVLLAIIICFEMIHCIKLHEISTNAQLTNMAIYGGNVNATLKREIATLKNEAQKMRGELGKKHMLLKHADKMPLLNKEKYDEENNVYVLEMRVPSGLKKEDVSFELDDNILGIGFGGIMEMENKNAQSADVFSVYRFFTIPETKATVKDIEYDIDDNILEVKVPIIK